MHWEQLLKKTVHGIRNRGISRGGRKSEGKTRSCYFRGYRKIDLPYEEGQFDCVLFGDVLEHLFDPWAVIEKVKPYIKQNGVILASIPNVAHISVLAPYLLEIGRIQNMVY